MTRRPFSAALVAALPTALALATLVLPVAGAEPRDTPFAGEERVTAVDLVVELRRAGRDRPAGDLPGGLRPAELRLEVGGAPRRVVVVETAAEPWTTVLWFDLALTGASRAGRAARDLTAALPALVEHGEVTIVVADPEPRRIVAATRDRDALTAALGQIGSGGAADHDLLALRWDAMRTLASGVDLQAEHEVSQGELLRRAAEEEAVVVRRQLDRLVLSLAEERPPGVRRLLLLVTDGFDERPATFYHGLGLPQSEAGPDLAADVAVAARTLAAYGWATFPVVPPPARALEPGVRVGKWRLLPPSESTPPEYDPTTAGTDREKSVPMFQVNARREDEREPERAAEYLKLGRSLLEQGKSAEAEEALERAYHHFYGDPRTADQQAETLFALAEAVEAQGRRAEARELVAVGVTSAPDFAAARGVRAARLVDPERPVAALANETAGAILRGEEAIAEAVGDFAGRVRITYQVEGPPDGDLEPVELVLGRSGWAARHPAWGRSATPDTVAAARARRLLEGDLATGDLALRVSLRGNELHVAADLPPRQGGEGVPVLRLTVAQAGPDEIATVRHERVELEAGGETWSTTIPVELDPDRPYLAVVVEELDRGGWGGALVEAPTPQG